MAKHGVNFRAKVIVHEAHEVLPPRDLRLVRQAYPLTPHAIQAAAAREEAGALGVSFHAGGTRTPEARAARGAADLAGWMAARSSGHLLARASSPRPGTWSGGTDTAADHGSGQRPLRHALALP